MSLTIFFFILIIFAFLYALTIGDHRAVGWRMKVCAAVTIVYLVSTYIVSFSFDDGNTFVVSDSMRYIYTHRDVSFTSYEVRQYLISCYVYLSDNNGLYNVCLNYLAQMYKYFYIPVNSMSLAFPHALFGVLCSITLFRILSSYFPYKEAYKYTVIFALVSLYHFYSVIILRDIVISYLFLLCIEIVLKKFKLYRLFFLIFYMIIAIGIRLFSGYFIAIFILYYIYSQIPKRFRVIIVPIYGFIILWIVLQFFTKNVEQTFSELDKYNVFSQSRSGQGEGLVARLQRLPIGIRQVVLAFLSQTVPLPPYDYFFSAKSFSNYYMSTMAFVYSVWWYFIFYTLAYILLIEKKIRSLSQNQLVFLGMAILFIMANTVHLDIRRMMPVYPIIYLFYLKLASNYSHRSLIFIRRRLLQLYLLLIIVVQIIRW